MNLKSTMKMFLLTAVVFIGHKASAQRTYEEMEHLTVNEQVTTVITASEPIRFVDYQPTKLPVTSP